MRADEKYSRKVKSVPAIKDITGKRFGQLTAICPTDKRQGTNIIWRFRCDCGEIVERVTSHMPDDAACEKCKPKGSKLRTIQPNMRYGRLTTVECLGKKGKEYIWLLKCDCGNTVILPVSSFCGGNTRSCGCLRQQTCRDHFKYTGLGGKQFGKLTVLGESDRDRKGQILWACICDCGREAVASTSDLNDGKVLSCGNCEMIKRYCVYKHLFPDGRVYIGLTSSSPWHKWTTGSKYQGQQSMRDAIDSIGGYDAFLHECDHYYFTTGNQWVKIDGPVSFYDANLFSEEEAKRLKKGFIDENDATNPDNGLNCTTGALNGFIYSKVAKKRQAQTKTGENNRSDFCVYIHRNKENKKVYIGLTCQQPEKRWRTGKGYSSNSHFGRAIAKYGWDGFTHEIVRKNLTIMEANQLEQELIAKYDSRNPDNGYNVTAGGDGSTGAAHTSETKEKLSRLQKERIAKTGKVNFKGQKHTPETIAKMRASHKGKHTGPKNAAYGAHKTEEQKQYYSRINSRAINQYDLDGKLIKQYPSGKAAAEALGVTAAAISAAVAGKTKSCKGYIWRHAEDAEATSVTSETER